MKCTMVGIWRGKVFLFCNSFVCFLFLVLPASLLAQEDSSDGECYGAYDHEQALSIGQQYREALANRDYERLKELRVQKENMDLWAREQRECTAGSGTDTGTDQANTPEIVSTGDDGRTADLKCAEGDVECDEREKKCSEFIQENDEHGYDWLDQLPNCSCNKTSPPTSEWGFTPYTGGMKSFTIRKYHPGATGGCFRSPPIDVGNPEESAQQCCYTDDGKLITAGGGAGTPDIDAADGMLFGYDRGHLEQDTKTWEVCGFEIYNQIRKPNNGNNCEANVKP